MKNIESYIEDIKTNTTKNMKIKKEVWNKKVEILIPSGCKVKQISKEQLFIIKLIYYLDYISGKNLKTILSPIMNERKAELEIGELSKMKLIKFKKKGYYGTFYYLSKYCLKLLTDEKSEGEYPLNTISNCTLETQDYRHLYLSEMVVGSALNRLRQVYKELPNNTKEAYFTALFIKNISFDLMLKLPDRESYLKGIGYSEMDIKKVVGLKTYGLSEREKYIKAIQKSKSNILGYNEYYKAYKNHFGAENTIFEKYNALYSLIELDKDFDYFSLVERTVRGLFDNEAITGVRHNLIKHQTKELRQGLSIMSQIVANKNGLKSKVPDSIVADGKISDYQDSIQLYNAICINLKKTQNGYTKSGIIGEDEVPFYQETIKYLSLYTDKKNETQEEYNKYKRIVSFNDSKAALNPEDRPIIYLKGLELRNIFIKDIALRKNKQDKVVLFVSVVNIDRNKEIKNFKSNNLRRDYFGVCEMLKNIENDLGISVYIEYTYCYPQGSNIVGYEQKFERIFRNEYANTNIKGADKFIVKRLEEYVPYDEYMKKINKIIICDRKG